MGLVSGLLFSTEYWDQMYGSTLQGKRNERQKLMTMTPSRNKRST